jgi:hypothetical protein
MPGPQSGWERPVTQMAHMTQWKQWYSRPQKTWIMVGQVSQKKLRENGVHAKRTEADSKLWQRECFCQEIIHHSVGGDVREHHMTPEYTVLDSMVYDIYVLSGWVDNTML